MSMRSVLIFLAVVVLMYGVSLFSGSQIPVVSEHADLPELVVIEPEPVQIITPSERFAVQAAPIVVPVPVSVTIPKIGLEARIQPVSLTAQGIVDTPQQGVGWYLSGPKPGETGNANVNAHFVTEDGKPGPFYRFSRLSEGDEISVASENGQTRIFKAYKVLNVAVADFPFEKVYGPASGKNLILVTCAGRYDARRGDYTQRTIVYARLSE